MNRDVEIFSHNNAKKIIAAAGLLEEISAILQQVEKNHDSVRREFAARGWDVEEKLFPNLGYRIDAFKDKIAVEIEAISASSIIDVLHRDYFRFMMLHSMKIIDAGVSVLNSEKKVK